MTIKSRYIYNIIAKKLINMKRNRISHTCKVPKRPLTRNIASRFQFRRNINERHKSTNEERHV